ncbi:MAG: YciI family protein [Gemmatimonadaceae bacterium]
MPRYLVASYLPDDFDPSTVTEETGAAIHALNDEMEAAGVLKFACGVSPVSSARTLRRQPDGSVLVTDGPYTETKEHIGGFYLLDAADMDEVLGWLRKGAGALMGPVEVRQIFYQPDPRRESDLRM